MSPKKTPKTTDATAKRRAPRKKSTEATAPKARKATAKKAAPRKPANGKEAAKTSAPTRPAAKATTPDVAARTAPKAASGPTHEQIAARAAEIWRETGGLPFDNWIRAERELVG